MTAIALVFLIAFFAYLLLRRTRRHHKNPKYIPTPLLKKLWKKWEPTPRGQLPRNSDHFEPIASAAARRLGPSAPSAGSNSRDNAGNATIDRNTSVRSVMTLPAYRPNVQPDERVLGREGERGGIDMVLEFPETVDDEERAREEEMEALYQVRLARRRENEERDERRRLRREARERGDVVALREIQARARASSAASAGRSVEELRAEHERLKRERQRAVSSVSYGDLGVARHDGTRLRANSEESERTGLLGDAASFAASSRHHRRDRSASSVISIDTVNSDLPSPGFTRTRGDSGVSRPESPLRRVSTQDGAPRSEGRAGSSPEIIDHDDAPPHSPPGYENVPLDGPSMTPSPPLHHQEPPPDYSSPVLGRGEGSSRFESQIPPGAERSGPSSSEHNQGRRKSSTSNLAPTRVELGDRRSSTSPGRGVGGVPQLPSLRLGSLPSIQVDPGSPSTTRLSEDGVGPAR